MTAQISKPVGILWFLAGALFMLSALLVAIHRKFWWIIGLIAVIISQIVISMSWGDAKFGTIINLIILGVIVASITMYFFEKEYRQDVKNSSQRLQITDEVISEQDISHLPEPVARYLRYVGVIGKPKVYTMYAELSGQMRQKDKDWFTFTAEQHNYFQDPTRLFFMKGTMFGVTVPGYHKYIDDKASMDIKLAGIVPVVRHSDLFETETVTYFNDICLMAPACLIDKKIKWQAIDNRTAIASYTNRGITITATLYFNNKGELINFESDDRTAVDIMHKLRFSTPVSKYKDFNGYKLPSYGKAVWHYPDGAFTYGKIQINNVQYNS